MWRDARGRDTRGGMLGKDARRRDVKGGMLERMLGGGC